MKDVDYTISYANGWTERDGYHYYDSVVRAGGSATLIESCQPNHDGPNGEQLQVTILTQSIQAHYQAVADAGWAINIMSVPSVEPAT